MIALTSCLIILAAVYILAVITEAFFVVSLDEVAKRLKMPSDVAGASLMAVGSSAPELFIALAAVILGGEHGAVGVGTIVGSAVFNILVITGASALLAGTLTIRAGGVERDVIFYLGSIALLLYVFWDGTVVLWEAGLFMAAYAVYIFILWRWGENNPELAPEPHHEKEQGQGILATVNGAIAKVFGLIARDPEKNYIWAMLISIVAIAAISWVLVENAVILADAIGLSPIVVSITLLAAGTSAPDLIASVSVAKEGRGEMAVANAVGSDIFDILIGLGLPWVILLGFLGTESVHIDTEGLMGSIFLLSGTVILLYIFMFTERKLTRREGWILLAAYAAYVVYAVYTTGG